MTKPVHESMEVGSMGETIASILFQELRWAPPSKIGQDIGDDFITFARITAEPGKNAIAYDRSAPVFVQVKASRDKYSSPTAKRGKDTGWWYEESETDHFDHWIDFGLPYLLVLVDISARRAFWVEVRGPAIRSTGKGRKIFVPASNTLDAARLDDLNRVALSRRANDIEGSVWSGRFDDLPPADRLRYALVMPRLVAPHGNRTVDEISYEQASAMLMGSRLGELSFAVRERNACPDPNSWANHREWGWRFAGALEELLRSGHSDRFEALESKARHAFERDICRVVISCSSYVGADAARAASHLKLQRNTRPADRGWIRAQEAAFLLELGRTKEASEAAQAAIFALRGLDGDLTVSAIRGGTAAVLYSISGIDSDLATTVTAQDNAAAWWRASDVSRALEHELGLRFGAWTADTSVRFADSDPRGRLTAAAWNAAFSANWGSWRHISSQIAQLTLTSSTTKADVSGSLGMLAYVGDRDATKNAGRKVWRDGPVDALREVVTGLAVLPPSKRIEGPTMGLLAVAGDLLPQQVADQVIEGVLETLAEDGDIRQFSGGWTDRWSEIPQALRRVLGAASIAGHQQCADLVVAHIRGPETRANNLLAIVDGLALADLPGETVNKLVEGAAERSDHYGLRILEQLAEVSERAMDELRARAQAGSAPASRALLVNGSTDRGDFLALGRNAATSVAEMVKQAGGTPGVTMYTHSTVDRVHDLAIAAFQTGDNHLWKALTDALAALCLPKQQTEGAVRMLAKNYRDLPKHVQRKLKKLAPALSETPLAFMFGQTGFDSAVAQLNIAAGNIDDEALETHLLMLRTVDPLGFVTTLDLWNSPNKLSFLTMMAVDQSAQVRAQAVFSLMAHAAEHATDAARAHKVVRAALMAENGCVVVDAIAQGLAEFSPPDLSDLVGQLRQHPSALVRGSLHRIPLRS